jgi:hypothetical protein
MLRRVLPPLFAAIGGGCGAAVGYGFLGALGAAALAAIGAPLGAMVALGLLYPDD